MRRELLLICSLLTILGLLVQLTPDETVPGQNAAAAKSSEASPQSLEKAIGDWHGAESAIANERRLAPSNEGVVRVKLVDAVSGEPVNAATVRFATPTATGHAWSKRQTDPQGVVVHADDVMPVLMAVEHANYAPQFVVAAFAGGEQVVALQPGASLRLRFVDGSGEPMAGVAAHLLPPILSGRKWRANWREATVPEQWSEPLLGNTAEDLLEQVGRGWSLPMQRVLASQYDLLRESLLVANESDARGYITFAQLPAALSWRWGTPSRLVQVSPDHESVTATVGRGIRTRTGDAISNLSGAIALAPGEQREITVTVSRGATIVGCIPAIGAHLRPQVKLYHLSRVRSAQGPSAVELLPAGFTTTAEDGTFGFAGIRPGAKIVRAFWRDTEHDYVFVSRAAHVAEGDRHDLGLVQALTGTFTIKVPLQDRQQRPIDPQTVIGDARPAALVQVEAWRQEGDLIDSILEIVSVPVAREVRFHGFPDGTLRLKATYGLDWPELTGGRRIVPAPEQKLSLPTATRLDLPLTVETRVACQLSLQAPRGPVAALELWARPLLGGSPQRMAIPADPAGRARLITMKLLPEPYELLVRATGDARGDAGSGALVGHRVVDFSAERRHSLLLCAGAVVSGVCRNVRGLPIANTRLSWAPEGWQRSGNPVWLLSAETDERGQFVLAGLPAGWKLRGALAGTDLLAPDLGAEKNVQLTLPR